MLPFGSLITTMSSTAPDLRTFAETHNQAFDWFKWLQDALVTTPTEDQWDRALWIAQSWVTCACGNQCAIIPRHGNGMPKDDILRELGSDAGFFGAIKKREPDKALQYLRLIEHHSAYLIEKELAKQAANDTE